MPTATKSKGKAAKGAGAAKRKSKAPEVVEAAGRDIVYETITADIAMGDNPITVEVAMGLLGFEVEGDKEKFGSSAVPGLTYQGKKVRCLNNVKNRPLYMSKVMELVQEILRKGWRFNGEPIIIGRTALVLNGQHTLLALILAAAEFAENPDKWPAWESEPLIEKLIVYGVEESDDVVNTMDTCKPRSLTDVIYRAAYFKDLPSKDQRNVAKVADHAVKMLWHRTGIHANAFALKRTHSESIAFLERHPKLLDAVKHVYEEDNREGKIGKWLSLGYAAAALYLMGTSDSDPQTYYLADPPSEQLLDTKKWARACDYFTELAGGSDSLKAVRNSINKLLEGGAGSFIERWSIIAKSWPQYAAGKPVTAKTVELEFATKEGERFVAEHPLFGGIDIGDEGLPFADPSPEEVTTAAEEVKEKKDEKKFGKTKKTHRKGETWAKGDTAWIQEVGMEPTYGEVKDTPYVCTDKLVRVIMVTDEGDFEFLATQLTLDRYPDKK